MTSNILDLLPDMRAFMRTMEFVHMEIGLQPNREHLITHINYSDLLEMREDFLQQLVASVTRFVLSKERQNEIKKELIENGNEPEDASSLLIQKAHNLFRPSSVQGQFSELLLANLLQFHFKALPLVRKMSITTNPGVERHGADAIHISENDNGNILYLGEAKTYTSGFKKAFKAATESILKTHRDHRSELNLYTFGDFISRGLEEIAKKYLSGKIDLRVDLVCIITYSEDTEVKGTNRDEILEFMKKIVLEKCKKINTEDYSGMKEPLLDRMNYILFPISELNELLDNFKKKLGL